MTELQGLYYCILINSINTSNKIMKLTIGIFQSFFQIILYIFYPLTDENFKKKLNFHILNVKTIYKCAGSWHNLPLPIFSTFLFFQLFLKIFNCFPKLIFLLFSKLYFTPIITVSYFY